MATYNPTTNFTAKDALAAGDPNKIIRGADFGVEFDAISTAINEIPDSPFVNVKDYGALGDGVADDTAAIQSAINYASSNGIQTVLIPDGHYRYTTLRMYHEATDNPNFQETPNRDGKIRLLGHGRFSTNDLKNYDPATRGVYGTFLEGIAGGEGIIVDPTDAFDDQDSRNFVMEHMTVTANNTGYVIVNRQCPEFTLVNVAIKQVNYQGNGILNRNAWFTNIENCAIFGPSTETNSPEEPDNNTGDGLVGETDFFAGEFNIHNSLIDSWANGFKWNAGQFVNVALRDTAVQNCNNYNIYGLAGTIFNLLLDNVYLENQSTQGVSFIKSVDDCFRVIKMTNCFMLAGNGGVARVSSHCIDLDNPDAIHIDNMYVFRPRQTFLNVTALRNLQNVSGEIKNSMFLTDEDLSAEPTIFLLDGILPNVHNCVWPTMSQGVHNTTGDIRLYDESVYGKYLRSFTDVTGTTAHSKFSYGDTEQVTVTTSPYRMSGASIEQKAYYDLTHAISAGLAVYLPAPTSVKTDGRVIIVRNNENTTSASNYPFINVFISTGVPPSTGFLVQLAPSEAAMFVFDGKGTNGGDFKCVGKWSDSGADYTVNADTGSETFQSGYESLRFTGGTAISTAVASPSFGEDEVTISLDTSSDINFGDNEKAVFGAGSDLQIYHSGTNSFIQETGTGNLILQADEFLVQNTAGNANYIRCQSSDESVQLRFGGATKLSTKSTGIDVTGTVTADGLTVDGSATISGGNRNLTFLETDTTDVNGRITQNGGELRLQTIDDALSVVRNRLIINHASGDISFYDSAGTSQDLFWDASTSRLGLGTTNPSTTLDVAGTVTADGLTVDGQVSQSGAAPSYTIVQTDTTDLNTRFQVNGQSLLFSTINDALNTTTSRFKINNSSGDISFYDSAGTSEDLYWDASTSRLGINNVSPDARLDVTSQNVSDVAIKITDQQAETALSQNYNINMITKYSDEQFTLYNTDTYRNASWIGFDNFGQEITFGTGAAGAGAQRMVIDSSGNVGIGTASPTADLDVNGVFTVDVTEEDAIITGATPALEFVENDSGGSRMRMAWNTSGALAPTMYQSLYGDTISTYGGINIQTRASDGTNNQVVYAYDPINDRNWWGTRTAGDVAMQLESDGTFNVRGGDVSFENSAKTSEDFYWDASTSRLGLGTTAPGYSLDVQSATDAEFRLRTTGIGSGDHTIARFQIEGTTASNYIYFGDADDVNSGQIRYVHSDDSMRMYVKDQEKVRLTQNQTLFYNGTTEIARFDTSNNFLVGTTSTSPHTTTNGAEGGVRVSQGGMLALGRNSNPALNVNRITDDGTLAMWYRNGTNVGNISVTSTTTTYNTSSDQRLKDNIVDAPSASDDIDAIQVRSFDWKADGSHQKYGMVAQELQTVAPDAVTQGDTAEDMMGVDFSKLVPMLVKEVQELRARVAQLENV